MVEICIDGDRVEAEDGQTVMQAARASGIEIPYFCWHPELSVPATAASAWSQVEGDGSAGWVEIACNMPVRQGHARPHRFRAVRAYRKSMLQLITLNHPVDCGICDKAGECTLQDYHYEYNGAPSVSRDAKVRATKFHALSERIVLDNERCILCSRCVRFTREISKSNALGIQQRGDHSLVRAAEDGALRRATRTPTTSSTSARSARCCRGRSCTRRGSGTSSRRRRSARAASAAAAVDIWHRKAEWKLNALDPAENARIDRVTPRENPAVNGPWICNKGRDLAAVFERPRATAAMIRGEAVELDSRGRAGARADRRSAPPGGAGLELGLERGARRLPCRARRALRLPSSRPTALAEPGERLEDELLIRADKNPNRRAAARAVSAAARRPRAAFPAGCDLVLVWGEGFDFDALPPGARIVFLDAWRHRRTATPTSSFRSASRPSAAATTRTSPAW